MSYRLHKNVVLFQMCGEDYLFPSRAEGRFPPILLPVSEQLTSVLQNDGTASFGQLSAKDQKKLLRLVKIGMIEEC